MSFRSLFSKTPAEAKALDNLSEHDRTVRIPAIKAAVQSGDMNAANVMMKDWLDIAAYCGPNGYTPWEVAVSEMRAIWTGSDLGAYPKCLQ